MIDSITFIRLLPLLHFLKHLFVNNCFNGCGGQFPGRQLCLYAGLCLAAPCGWHPIGQQKVHEYEAPGGYHRRCLH